MDNIHLFEILLLIVGITVTAIHAKEYTYWHRFWLFIDILLASIFWGRSGLTISARTGLAKREGKLWGRIGCKILGAIEKDHCELAIEADKRRARKALRELGE